MFAGELEELLYAIHVAVVGNRQCRHPQCLGLLEQFVNGRESVQNRVLGMYVKMYERHCISSRLWCVLLADNRAVVSNNKDNVFAPNSQIHRLSCCPQFTYYPCRFII